MRPSGPFPRQSSGAAKPEEPEMNFLNINPLLAAAIGAVLGAYFLEFFKRLGGDTYDLLKRHRGNLHVLKPLLGQVTIISALFLWFAREQHAPMTRIEGVYMVSGLYICTMLGDGALLDLIRATLRLPKESDERDLTAANPSTQPERSSTEK